MIITSRRQQRLLAAIDSALRRSDPRLVARFAVFAQLTRGKAMPRVEQVTAGPVLLVLSAVFRELRVYLMRCRVRVRRRRGAGDSGRRAGASGRKRAGVSPWRQAGTSRWRQAGTSRWRQAGTSRWRQAGALVLIPAAAVVGLLVLLVLLVRGNPVAACTPAAAGSHTGTERVMTLRGYWPGPSCPPGLVRGAPAGVHRGGAG